MPPPPATFGKLKYVSEPYTPAIEIVTHGNSKKGVRQMSGAKGIKSKFIRLYEGERPDIRKGEVKTKKVTECKFLTSDGFRYSSAMKESNNSGDYTSTFTKNMEHIPITKPETEEEKADSRRTTIKKLPAVPKNMSTSPCPPLFRKIPYVTQSVDRMPMPKKSTDKKGGNFTFTKKSGLFNKLDYIPQSIITKSKSEGDVEKVKDLTILDCGSFRPSSPSINTKAAVSGSFSPCRYEGSKYDEKMRLRATTPDKLFALPPQVKVWIS